MRPDMQVTPSELYSTQYAAEDGGGNGAGEGVQIQRLSHRHHAIMDFMFANPALSMDAVAKEFGVTPAWLSTVRNSDLFKARFNERRALMDLDTQARIGTKLARLAEDGIDALTDIIADDEQSGELKHNVAKTALETLGFLGKNASAMGQPAAQPVSVQVAVGSDVFAQAREMASRGHTAQVIEGKVNE